jgi:hypothetical protein
MNWLRDAREHWQTYVLALLLVMAVYGLLHAGGLIHF